MSNVIGEVTNVIVKKCSHTIKLWLLVIFFWKFDHLFGTEYIYHVLHKITIAFFFCIVSLSPRYLKCVLFHLGSEFLNDFFKPINTEMDRLKSFKKHRHGRRIKQLEKFEQKMKEERQKRIQQRQKEFFGEIEVHKYVSFFLSSTFQLF